MKIATIVRAENSPTSLGDIENEVISYLSSHFTNTNFIKNDILAKDLSLDIYFNLENPLSNNQILDSLLTSQLYGKNLFDIFIQDDSTLLNRKKKLMVFDMDSTVIINECIDEMGVLAGKDRQISEITEMAMEGKINFYEALEQRVALLKGLPVEKLQEIFDNKIRLSSKAEMLMRNAKNLGIKTLLISGGFTFFAEKIANFLNMDKYIANVLEIDNDHLTGKILGDLIGNSDNKLSLVTKYASENNIDMKDVMSVGDGSNDIGILTNSGIGIAYMAKNKVKNVVKQQINNTNLSSALYVQGYKKEELNANIN